MTKLSSVPLFSFPQVGYPLMIKAVLGGGGKGMRIVWNEGEFLEKLEQCKGESMKSFRDDRVLLERYIQKPRHIEFQGLFHDPFMDSSLL